MITLSTRIGRMNESQTIAMAQRTRELASKGIDVISLSLGEPDFLTPERIRNSAKKAIDDGYSFYTPVPGYKELREAVAFKLKRDNNLSYEFNQIVVSTGAKQSLINVILSIIDPGDEVLVPAPYWVSYIEMIRMAGGEPVIVEAGIDQDYKVNAEQLEKAITSKTRMMIFSSPCNPTGSVYTHEELKDIAHLFSKHPNIVLLSDEIYEYINFTGQHHSLASFPEVYNQTVVVNGLSKGFAMTGWRLGYIAAPLEIAKACEKIQGQFTSATCSITQRAALTALLEDPVEAKQMTQSFLSRRNLLLEELKTVPGFKSNTPDGAFYVFPDVSELFGKSMGDWTIQNADTLCDYLLEVAHVGVVTGVAFGAPNCIRISYATSEDKIKEALRRIREAVQALK